MMRNPFVTNGYAGAEYFCDRVQETEFLVRMLTNENNIDLNTYKIYDKFFQLWLEREVLNG